MIRRLFYMALGACLAVWVMRKLQSLRPEHVARRAAGRAVTLADRLREFAGEVRRHAASRESELRAELGLGSVNRISSVDRSGAVDGIGAHGNDDAKDGR
ncbi:hypothetical protein [Sphaerimonospora thailandensis]|uniref:Secreted protein n=1 Tax=Sphaerimonospora thailandensis TaxID=795644 RepID=A0A8J3RAK1_9ACTN|nr:hypothetical protein [Sphaerimonospora thailandensis]GIH70776.1 hypothetical protein Mth01_30290 [Sphaerimonospora thailandensis]